MPRAARGSPPSAPSHCRADRASLLVQFDLAGIAVSAGSACSSGAMKESAVLEAMGVAGEIANGFLRISFGPATSEADVDAFLAEWRRIAERRGARPHDLPRLPGDDAGRAGGARGDAAVDRGEVRQSAFAVALGRRGGRGDRGRAQARSKAICLDGGTWPSPARDGGAQLGVEGRGRECAERPQPW